jgi:hypothetical protein
MYVGSIGFALKRCSSLLFMSLSSDFDSLRTSAFISFLKFCVEIERRILEESLSSLKDFNLRNLT